MSAAIRDRIVTALREAHAWRTFNRKRSASWLAVSYQQRCQTEADERAGLDEMVAALESEAIR